MKLLAPNFSSKGFSFVQLMREDDVALFRKTKEGSDVESFEVVRVRKYPTYEIGGVTIEAHEAMPPSEAWGDDGFTFTTQEAAFDRFAKIHSENPYTVPVGTVTGGTRGRKRDGFELELPAGEFTVKQLHEKYPDKSVPFIHLRLKELKEHGKVKLVRSVKIEGGRGKPTNVYESVPLEELPPELADAQIVTGVI